MMGEQGKRKKFNRIMSDSNCGLNNVKHADIIVGMKQPFLKALLVPLLFPFCQNVYSFSKSQIGPNVFKKVQSETLSLNTPVSQIDDGAVYYIRSAGYANRYWDVYYANYNNGNHIQVHSLNYSTAQKFIAKRQFDSSGQPTYRFSPLGFFDKILRLDNSNNASLVLGDEGYSQYELLADKYTIEASGTNKFILRTGSSNFDRLLVPDDSSDGAHVVQRSITTLDDTCRWEFLKVDYLGLDVCNKTYINGTTESRFVVTPPSTGDYIIETQNYTGYSLDTFLTLKTGSEDQFIASNDDGGEGTNARISYHLIKDEHYAVYVRGYSSTQIGYTNLVFRPSKCAYMAGFFDGTYDCVSELNQSKAHLRNLGCFGQVYANRPKSHLLDTDSSNNQKMNHEYFVYSGHGSDASAAVAFYNGPEGLHLLEWDDLPLLEDCEVAIWNCCHGARKFYKNNYSLERTSMAYRCIENGAHYSIGWDGPIGNLVSRHFVPYFFSELYSNGGDVYSACTEAILDSIGQEFWYWYYHNLLSTEDDFANAIVYQFGDSINQPQNRGDVYAEFSDPRISLAERFVVSIEGFLTTSSNHFRPGTILLRKFNEKMDSFIKRGNSVLGFHTHFGGSDYYFATIVDPTSLFAFHYDLLNEKIIPPEVFEDCMNKGLEESWRSSAR